MQRPYVALANDCRPGAEQVHIVEITADPAISGVFATSLVEDPALSD